MSIGAISPARRKGPVKAMDHPFLTEIGVHHFDSFRYLFDRRPTSVFALSQPPGSGYEKEAAAAAVIELEGGLPIQYGGTFAAARYEFALWIEGSKGISGPIGNAYGGGRAADDFFVLASPPVPKGDELPYPKAGTVSLLNQFRDAVLEAAS